MADLDKWTVAFGPRAIAVTSYAMPMQASWRRPSKEYAVED